MYQEELEERHSLLHIKQSQEEIEMQFMHTEMKKGERIIFYFNLTQNKDFIEEFKKLLKVQVQWEHGFLGQIQTELYQDPLSIYYFHNLLKENSQYEIDICKLINLKILLFNKVQQCQQIQFKVVLHYNLMRERNNNNIILSHLSKLLDGLITDLENIIIIDQDILEIKGFQGWTNSFEQLADFFLIFHTQEFINQQQEKSIEKLYQSLILFEFKKINSSFIEKLIQSSDYNNFQFNDYCSIGYECILQGKLNSFSYSYKFKWMQLQNNFAYISEDFNQMLINYVKYHLITIKMITLNSFINHYNAYQLDLMKQLIIQIYKQLLKKQIKLFVIGNLFSQTN